MDNIEQIKQERDKLQERLNNAAKFFREQKAQIEALTKENEKLMNSQNSVDHDATIQNLQTRLAETENEVGEVKEANKALIEKNKELEDIQKDDLKRYNELENNYEGLQNTYQKIKEENEQLKEKNEQLNEILEKNKKLSNTLTKLENIKDMYETLSKKYGQLKEDLEKRTQNLRAVENSQNEELKKLESARDEWKEKFDKLDGDYIELKGLMAAKEQFNKTLQDTYNEVYTELNELKETNKKNVNYCEDLKKKYDDLENEKLAWEADYKNLEDKFKSLKEDSEINKEIEEKLTDTLFKIHELTDNILNPVVQETKQNTKSEMIIESNTKRIGSEFETTNEVMSI